MKHKPQAVLMSARANVFYLQHVRVCQDADRVIYLSREGDIDKKFNIPEKNTAFLLLGKGTSITDSAVRKLAESGVLLGFCGTGGSPLYTMSSPVFFEPQSEYRPTEYMQDWISIWMNDDKRLLVAKYFSRERIKWIKAYWASSIGLSVNPHLIDKFTQQIDQSHTTAQLMSAEAQWAKGLYGQLSGHYKISDFTRQEGKQLYASKSERINSMLDHGNYIAYGYAATVLNTLGISFAFPVMHGKTRRGALVFDVADIYKDALVMSLAFDAGHKKMSDQEFRYQLIENCWENKLMDKTFDIIKKAIAENA